MYHIICRYVKDHITDKTFVVNPTDYGGSLLLWMQKEA